MPREYFEQELDRLEEALLELVRQVDTAIQRAIDAFERHDIRAARRIIADDDHIDHQQNVVEEAALRLIARQAPLAVDLRMISAVMSIASELERMGDYAEGIAKITMRGTHASLLTPFSTVAVMAEKAQRMLREAVQAFVNRDVDIARRLRREDSAVDQLLIYVQTELLRIMRDRPDTIEQALHLLFVAHNLERTADRATNIGERLIFVVTGELVELND